MWVLSQAKNALVKVSAVYIKKLDIFEDYFICGNDFSLGQYKSEERALEIIQEFMEAKNKHEYSVFLGKENSDFVGNTYEMPKE
ncbi:MAG: hypothetical protein M0Q88_00240 [Bacilli bacterium]|nr:hypothetical protein [Bacilli bacterium]